MGLEAATFINDLVTTNPVGTTDTKAQGDDHLRLIKSAAKATFPNADRAFYFPRSAAKTANYSVVAADMQKFFTGDATGGAFNFTLPTLGAGNDGWYAVFQKIDTSANACTLVGTINGVANLAINAQYNAVLVWWSGTAWFAVPLPNTAFVRTITGDATLTLADVDSTIICNPGATTTITLPAAASWKGRTIQFKQITSNFTTILDGNAAETIDGAATLTLVRNGDVAELMSDGTNIINRSALSSIGRQTIYIPAVAMTLRTTTGATLITLESATNKVMRKALVFGPSTNQFAQFALTLPKSWNAGTVTARFIWEHPATVTNFGVVWGIQAMSLADDDNFDTAFGTAQTVTDTGGTTNDHYKSDETSAITLGNTPAKDEMSIFQIYRDAVAGGDTLAVDAYLFGIELYYNTDAPTDA